MKKLTRRQRYFIKQKLIGLAVVLVNIILALTIENWEPGILFIPLGLFMMFSKDMIWMDDYFREVEERREQRRRRAR